MPSEPATQGAAALSAETLIRPRWAAPASVGAVMSTRAGGVSQGPWASLNLGRSVGDDVVAVAENRRRFTATLGGRAVWLRQVHGVNALALDEHTPEHPEPAADAAWTRTPGIACVVGAADCLPVLFATRDGRAVAAAHAGWRGLAAGVLQSTVAALAEGAGAQPEELVAWLGPCIGPAHFEVGVEVLHAFGHVLETSPALARCTGAGAGQSSAPGGAPHFQFAPRPDGAPRWRADLRGLARHQLVAIGLREITAHSGCTYAEASTFFSHRRDSGARLGGQGAAGGTGRMAAAVWINPAG